VIYLQSGQESTFSLPTYMLLLLPGNDDSTVCMSLGADAFDSLWCQNVILSRFSAIGGRGWSTRQQQDVVER
jgi:hypothetical protein